MNTQPQKIQFQEVRDFGQVMNAGFTFMRQHFKRLFLSQLSIGGPFLLVGVGVSALFMVRMQSWATVPNPNTGSASGSFPFDWKEFALTYVVNILAFMVGYVMITAVVNAYIKLYKESPDNQPDIQLGDVWKQVRSDFLHLLGLFALLVLFSFIVAGVLFGLAYTLFTSVASEGAKVGLAFLYFLGVFGVFIYFSPYLGGVLVTQSYFERTNFFTGLRRTFYLVRGQWWLTFGLGFVNTIIMYVVFIVCYLPFYFLMMINMIMGMKDGSPNFSGLTWIAVGMTVFMTLGYLIVFIIHYVMAAVHYHNLLERKEGHSLLNKIQSIGTHQQTTNAPVDFYDEEEKY